MQPGTIRAITQGLLAVVAVAIGGAYALVAQSQGHDPEPPAWLAVIIGGAVTYYYAASSHINGQTAALQSIGAAISARRAGDPAAVMAAAAAAPEAPGAPTQTPGA